MDDVIVLRDTLAENNSLQDLSAEINSMTTKISRNNKENNDRQYGKKQHNNILKEMLETIIILKVKDREYTPKTTVDNNTVSKETSGIVNMI